MTPATHPAAVAVQQPSLAQRLGLDGAHNAAVWDKLISGGGDLAVT